MAVVDSFAARLREASEGMSLRQIAQLSGLTHSIVAKYLRHEVEPQLRNAALLAHALGFSLDGLLDGTPSPPRGRVRDSR